MFGLFNGFNSNSGSGYIPEMEQTISQLERGTLVTKFSWRKRAEKKTLAIRRETRQIVWTRPSTSGAKPIYDGAVSMREVKEVRLGKNSKDFEKWPDDAKKHDYSKCFIIIYGQEFKTRVLSFAGKFVVFTELTRRFVQYL